MEIVQWWSVTANTFVDKNRRYFELFFIYLFVYSLIFLCLSNPSKMLSGFWTFCASSSSCASSSFLLLNMFEFCCGFYLAAEGLSPAQPPSKPTLNCSKQEGGDRCFLTCQSQVHISSGELVEPDLCIVWAAINRCVGLITEQFFGYVIYHLSCNQSLFVWTSFMQVSAVHSASQMTNQ